jgi:hypothetical protein
MLALIAIFTISLLTLAIFLGYKVKHLRAGKLNVPDVIVHPIHGIKAELYDMERRVLKGMKYGVRYAIFTSGKIWIVALHTSNRYLRNKFPKLFEVKISQNSIIKRIALFFAKTMAEYRVRMRRFKHRLVEEDKKIEEE